VIEQLKNGVPRHAISWERVRSMTSYLVGLGTWATV